LCKVTVRVGVSTDSENNMNHWVVYRYFAIECLIDLIPLKKFFLHFIESLLSRLLRRKTVTKVDLSKGHSVSGLFLDCFLLCPKSKHILYTVLCKCEALSSNPSSPPTKKVYSFYTQRPSPNKLTPDLAGREKADH
jgi:hypothetical protein